MRNIAPYMTSIKSGTRITEVGKMFKSFRRRRQIMGERSVFLDQARGLNSWGRDGILREIRLGGYAEHV